MMKELKIFLRKNESLVSLYQRIVGYNPRAKQWCRVVMDQATEELVSKMDIRRMSVLEISGRKWEHHAFASYRNAFYPAFDICGDIMNETFDLIIAEQVFEHVRKPFRAGINVYNMLNPGGFFLITTPFLLRIHPNPDDCTRWSKTGIRYFLEECGFCLDNIESYAWGNRTCVTANFGEWMPYSQRKHSLENEEEFPVVVWALARK